MDYGNERTMGINDTLSGDLFACKTNASNKSIATFAAGRLLGYEVVLYSGDEIVAAVLQSAFKVKDGVVVNKESIYFGDAIRGCITGCGIRVAGSEEMICRISLDNVQHVTLGDSVHFDTGALKWELK